MYDSAIVWLYDAYTPLDNLLLDQSEAYRRVETPGGQRFGLITDQGVTYALIPVSGDLTGDPAHGVTDKTALEMLGTARRAAPRLWARDAAEEVAASAGQKSSTLELLAVGDMLRLKELIGHFTPDRRDPHYEAAMSVLDDQIEFVRLYAFGKELGAKRRKELGLNLNLLKARQPEALERFRSAHAAEVASEAPAHVDANGPMAR